MECPACHHVNVDGARFCAKCGALVPAQTDEADPLVGSIVGGRFRISGILGEGGMGRVYTGEQQMGTSVRKVAVKTLLAQYARDPETYSRFMRECGTVSELEHPNTIKVHDFGQTPSGELYIAMEFLTGQSLEEVLEKTGPIPPERVDRIIGQVCGSLQEAHEKGIVHRDLKPANIFLTKRAGEEDYVKVLDFGIAKRGGAASKHEAKLTQQGKILGTPPYMSPEQFRGAELDARSDIYSLAVVTYEMLTGRLPFDADTPWAWATQHMTAQPFPFETVPLGAQVPPKMKAAVMRGMSKDLSQRQQSVREYFDELTLGTGRLTPMTQRSAGVDAQAPGHGTAVMSGGPSGMHAGSGPMMGGPPGVGPTYGEAGPGGAYPHAPAPMGHGAGMAPPMGHGPVPTAGGQAYPAPPVEQRRGGSLAPILAVVAVVSVVGIVLAVTRPWSSGGPGPSASGAGSSSAATVDASATATTTTTVAVVTNRVVPPPPQTAQPPGASIDGCCAALNALRNTAKNPQMKSKAASAAAVCPGIARLVKSGQTSRAAGLAQVRSSLVGGPVPGECN